MLKSSTRPHSELRAASAFFTELENLLQDLLKLSSQGLESILSSRLCDPDHYYGIGLIGKALAHALKIVDLSNASEGGRNGMSYIIGP